MPRHRVDSATKRCSRCHRYRLCEKFPADARAKDGLSSWCRQCRAGYDLAKRWYPGMAAQAASRGLLAAARKERRAGVATQHRRSRLDPDVIEAKNHRQDPTGYPTPGQLSRERDHFIASLTPDERLALVLWRQAERKRRGYTPKPPQQLRFLQKHRADAPTRALLPAPVAAPAPPLEVFVPPPDACIHAIPKFDDNYADHDDEPILPITGDTPAEQVALDDWCKSEQERTGSAPKRIAQSLFLEKYRLSSGKSPIPLATDPIPATIPPVAPPAPPDPNLRG